jgi:NADH-quinone oxidoreductase subunit E
VFNLTEERLDALVDALREDRIPEFTSVTLPQDQDEIGGNRRSDAPETVGSITPPVSSTIR